MEPFKLDSRSETPICLSVLAHKILSLGASKLFEYKSADTKVRSSTSYLFLISQQLRHHQAAVANASPALPEYHFCILDRIFAPHLSISPPVNFRQNSSLTYAWLRRSEVNAWIRTRGQARRHRSSHVGLWTRYLPCDKLVKDGLVDEQSDLRRSNDVLIP